MTLVLRGRVLRALLALPLLCSPPPFARPASRSRPRAPARWASRTRTWPRTTTPRRSPTTPPASRSSSTSRSTSAGTSRRLSTDITGDGPYPPAAPLENSSQGLGAPADHLLCAAGRGELRRSGSASTRRSACSQWDNPDQSTGRYRLHGVRDPAPGDQPDRRLKLADRLAVGGGVDLLLSKFSSHAPDRLAEPVPRAHRRRGDDLRQRHQHRRRLERRPAREPVREPLARPRLPPQGDVDHNATSTFTQILTGDNTVDAAVAVGLPETQAATATSPTRPSSRAASREARRLDVRG